MPRAGNIVFHAFNIAMVLLVVCLIILHVSQRNEYNKFVDHCNKSGGVVQLTEKSIASERYECLDNGKVKKLEGWQDA